jgi:hypothetical protein
MPAKRDGPIARHEPAQLVVNSWRLLESIDDLPPASGVEWSRLAEFPRSPGADSARLGNTSSAEVAAATALETRHIVIDLSRVIEEELVRWCAVSSSPSHGAQLDAGLARNFRLLQNLYLYLYLLLHVLYQTRLLNFQ